MKLNGIYIKHNIANMKVKEFNPELKSIYVKFLPRFLSTVSCSQKQLIRNQSCSALMFPNSVIAGNIFFEVSVFFDVFFDQQLFFASFHIKSETGHPRPLADRIGFRIVLWTGDECRIGIEEIFTARIVIWNFAHRIEIDFKLVLLNHQIFKK